MLDDEPEPLSEEAPDDVDGAVLGMRLEPVDGEDDMPCAIAPALRPAVKIAANAKTEILPILRPFCEVELRIENA